MNNTTLEKIPADTTEANKNMHDGATTYRLIKMEVFLN